MERALTYNELEIGKCYKLKSLIGESCELWFECSCLDEFRCITGYLICKGACCEDINIYVHYNPEKWIITLLERSY